MVSVSMGFTCNCLNRVNTQPMNELISVQWYTVELRSLFEMRFHSIGMKFTVKDNYILSVLIDSPHDVIIHSVCGGRGMFIIGPRSTKGPGYLSSL